MRDFPSIRWTPAQKKKLNSAVRKFNNAVEREYKKAMSAAGMADYLPARVSYQDIKSHIRSAHDLSLYTNRMGRALKPRAFEPVQQDNGDIVTRYDVREASISKSVINRRKSIERKARGITEETRGVMGTLEANNLKPITTDIHTMGRTGLERFIGYVDREIMTGDKERLNRYFSNYKLAIQHALLDPFPGTFDKRAKAVFDLIDGMTYAQKVHAYEHAGDFGTIDWPYDPLDAEVKLSKIETHWENMQPELAQVSKTAKFKQRKGKKPGPPKGGKGA